MKLPFTVKERLLARTVAVRAEELLLPLDELPKKLLLLLVVLVMELASVPPFRLHCTMRAS